MSSTRVAGAAAGGVSNLDERVLSAGTTQRFVLLLVLFVAESTGTAHDVVARLAAAAGSQHSAAATWMSYLAPVAVVAAARWLYRLLPRWKSRPSRVVPVTELGDGGQLARELAGLAAAAGLSATPRFLVDPAAASAGAVVFGTNREPIVRLNGGLVVTSGTDPDRFRAVVLHELAHIHNRDVSITYATVAMWRVLVVAALLPDAVSILATWLAGVTTTGSTATGTGTLVQETLIVVLVYLTRAQILRTREIYADRTAVRLWGVSADALLPGRAEDTAPAPAWSAFVEAWHTHPSWRVRGRSLVAPDELFTLRVLPLLVTGLAADIASAQLAPPFGAAGSWSAMAQYLLIAGLVTGVGGVALWRASVHAVLTGRRLPSGWLAGLWLGVGLGCGELTNSRLTGARLLPAQPETVILLVAVVALLMAWTAEFAELRIRTYRGESLNGAMLAGLAAPWLVLAFALLWWNSGEWATGWHFSVRDALATARLPAEHPPVLLRLLALLTALPGSDLGFSGLWWSVPLLWLVPLQLWLARLWRPAPRLYRYLERVFTSRGRSLAQLGLFVALLPSALLFTAGLAGFFGLAMLVWLAVLLTVRLVATRAATRASRYWLDRAQPGPAPPPADAPELRWVIRLGVCGGLAGWLGLLAEPAVGHAARTFGSWQVNSHVDLAWTVVVIAAAMMVVAAVAAAAANGRYPLITALIAAGTTAVVGVLGQCLKGSVDGCLGPLNNLTATCAWHPIRYLPLAEYALGYVFGPALLAAAVVAALTHAAATLLRGRRGAAAGAAGRPSGLARPMVAVDFLNAVAVCLVLSITVYEADVMVAPVPREDLLFEYAVSPTGHVRTGISPLADWMRFTGVALARLASAVDPLVKLESVVDGNPADARAAVARLAPPACAALAEIARHGDDEARLYDPAAPAEAQRLWLAYLAAVGTLATDCQALVRAPTVAAIKAARRVLDSDADALAAPMRELTDWEARKSGSAPVP